MLLRCLNRSVQFDMIFNIVVNTLIYKMRTRSKFVCVCIVSTKYRVSSRRTYPCRLEKASVFDVPKSAFFVLCCVYFWVLPCEVLRDRLQRNDWKGPVDLNFAECGVHFAGPLLLLISNRLGLGRSQWIKRGLEDMYSRAAFFSLSCLWYDMIHAILVAMCIFPTIRCKDET